MSEELTRMVMIEMHEDINFKGADMELGFCDGVRLSFPHTFSQSLARFLNMQVPIWRNRLDPSLPKHGNLMVMLSSSCKLHCQEMYNTLHFYVTSFKAISKNTSHIFPHCQSCSCKNLQKQKLKDSVSVLCFQIPHCSIILLNYKQSKYNFLCRI